MTDPQPPESEHPTVSSGTPAPGRTEHAEKASHAPSSESSGTPAPGRTGHAEKASHAPSSESSGTPAPDRRTVLASGTFGAVMLLAAVLVVVDAARLPDTSAVVGPAAVPLPVGVLLGAVGAGLLVQARMQLGAAVRGTAWQSGAGLRVVGMVVALVAFALLLPVLGYVVTSTALFVAAALLLGAPHLWRTAGYGWALAAIVFLLFDRLIGLSLPTGPWGF